MTDRQHKHDVLSSIVFVKCEIPRIAARNHEFPQAAADRPTYLGVLYKNSQPLVQDPRGAGCVMRQPVCQKIGKTLDIRLCPLRNDQQCHLRDFSRVLIDFSLGRGGCSPRDFACR